MRFLRLRIANYRGVLSAVVKFQPTGITLIQGPNEVGKTSLAEAIGILFEFPDSSRHAAVTAIKPVHRDEGAEIELEAQSGPYSFTYFKRFHKRPETTLVISRPKPDNLTGRPAHDRAEAILKETLDIDLWKALTIQQGDAIRLPALGKQTSLSVALDRAAGGRPADPREEGVYSLVGEEYSRYWTERGIERREVTESYKAKADAQAEVARIEQGIADLEGDIDRAAALQRELTDLGRREKALADEVVVHAASLDEIRALETRLSEAQLKLDGARKSEQVVRKERDERQGLIDAATKADKAVKETEESNALSREALVGAEQAYGEAQAAFAEADRRRKEGDRLASLLRADFDYYNNRLHLEQLGERKARIDLARKKAALAAELLARNKVTDKALKAIQDAERSFLTATTQLETGAPGVLLRGLASVRLTLDGKETTLGKGEERTFSVQGRMRLTLPEILDMEIIAGAGIESLSGKVEEARRTLEKACVRVGVADPDEARKGFEARREAERDMDTAGQVEKENLRDLTYEELERKLYGLEKDVPDYLSGRPVEPLISPDLESAGKVWIRAEENRREANNAWEAAGNALDAARNLREGLSTSHQETRIQLDLLAKDLKNAQERLSKARTVVRDEALEAHLAEASRTVAAEEANAGSAEASLKVRNPERAKALAEAAAGSFRTTQTRRTAANIELTEVQTRLKIHGEEGLHERLHLAQSSVERLSRENRSLLRRASAAKLLFDTMREERDRARRAYVAPLKEKVEELGRLVFDQTFQAEIGEDLRISARTLAGVTVPFDSLSGGTREQLSLIFRLACSMIVQESGGTPLMLDDALGYTDPERLRVMGAVLARAARNCQIVIFTCVPDRYAHVGEAAVVAVK